MNSLFENYNELDLHDPFVDAPRNNDIEPALLETIQTSKSNFKICSLFYLLYRTITQKKTRRLNQRI